MSAVVKVIAGIGLIVAGILLAPVIGPVLSGYLISIGASLVVQGVIQFIAGRGNKTPAEASKVNVRIAEPTRWLNAGLVRQGGGVLFAEFDGDGNLWYLVVHSDSMMNQRVTVILDDMPVALDGAGNVITDDFCLTPKKEPYKGSGARVTYFQVTTTTYSAANPTPPAIASFKAANPQWTDDHKLVGTTYSIVRCRGIDAENRYKVYKWRGPLGLGEPSISIVAEWAKAFDPRDETQILDDPSTYKFTRNAPLVWAWFRTHRYGRQKTLDSIQWDRMAEMADIADQNVTGIDGTAKRYTCDIAIPDDKERAAAEQEIMMTMDAQLVFDDDGKSWCRVGAYYAPTLTLTRNRDIIAMESIEAQNGESETQGVIVRYTDPDANYAAAPSAPWYNPNYYVPGEAVNFLTVDILACTNHNQALRLAKAIGMRSQPLYRCAPTTGLRGLRARQERVISLNYDNVFSGDHEIYSPIEIDKSGQVCSMAMVPVDADRWRLIGDEDKAKSTGEGAATPVPPELPSDVVVTVNNGRIEAVYTPVARDDARYEFQYIATAEIASGLWSNMTVQSDEPFAYSGAIAPGVEYSVRWRTVLTSGTVSAWSDPPTVVSDTVVLAPCTLLTVEGGEGEALVSWRNSISPSFAYSMGYSATTDVFADATAFTPAMTGALGSIVAVVDEGLLAGTRYYWAVAFDADDTPSEPVGPVEGIIT